MSLTQRKKRPLSRDTAIFRDDRLFIVACDDTYAPQQYFEFFNISRIQVHVVPTEDGTSNASSVLARLLEFDHEEDDELWMLLDTDHYISGTHVAGFNMALQQAGQNNIKVALSRPCFELWLLLHHVEESEVAALSNAKETEKMLREKLGEYNKRNLKAEHYPLSSVSDACKRAENLDSEDDGGRIPSGNTSRVYLLWKAIAAKALTSQLPGELSQIAAEDTPS